MQTRKSEAMTICQGHEQNPLANERGVAIILVLMMLLLLSILGATVLSTSTTEMKIAGNYSNFQNAFYAAEAGLDYAHSNGNIYLNVGSIITTNSYISTISFTNMDGKTAGSAKIMVKYVYTGSPPLDSYTEADAFKANYYSVSVEGTAQNNAKTTIDSEVARIVAK